MCKHFLWLFLGCLKWNNNKLERFISNCCAYNLVVNPKIFTANTCSFYKFWMFYRLSCTENNWRKNILPTQVEIQNPNTTVGELWQFNRVKWHENLVLLWLNSEYQTGSVRESYVNYSLYVLINIVLCFDYWIYFHSFPKNISSNNIWSIDFTNNKTLLTPANLTICLFIN